uniref:Transient receptor ion channel domain-containing protein n=1 Tax=Varanus komodoensis TaxID=61221 RepID=A0A8D2LFY2_VARKO
MASPANRPPTLCERASGAWPRWPLRPPGGPASSRATERATNRQPPLSFCPSPQQANWKEIVNKKLKFPEGLLGAIQDGHLGKVQQLLQVSDGILRQLDEAEDRAWREALNMAIRTGGEEMSKTLLRFVKFDFRQVHEALLVAVDTNQPSVVKLLLDRLDQEKGLKMDIKSFSLAFFDNSIDNSRFAPGVTPLTLACEKDLYEIVDMLMKKGHAISRPHKVSCACLECSNGRKFDLLKFSLSRINTYKGIASRAHLSIASEDAMLTAFKLSRELKRLSKKEPEFKPDYLALEQLCQEFAFELLGMCRNQSEVTAVLNDVGDDGIPNLARLRLAVNYNQKQFVAHPICQQVLSSIWCGSLQSWRGSTSLWKVFISCAIFLAMPFLCLIYWFAPKSKVGKILKIPVIKFLLHSASYLWFLVFLVPRGRAGTREAALGSPPRLASAGFFWFECKEVWIEGLRSYLLDWWNFLDIVILSMYLASFVLRVLIFIKGTSCLESGSSSLECHYYTQAERDEWRTEDPQFMAEVLFAVTSMLSFTRLAYILPAHETLGTLQISIGKMIDDMIRFMFIMMIILTAFLCGMNNIYVYYQDSERFNETFQFLFWTMLGMEEHNVVDMPKFFLAELMGRVLYGVFTIVMVVVLLNMLIAMITNSFQKIENDADVEWKFARSKLYLSFFREGLTLPVPFNIIPTPKSIFYRNCSFLRTHRGLLRFMCCYKPKRQQKYPPLPTIVSSQGPFRRLAVHSEGRAGHAPPFPWPGRGGLCGGGLPLPLRLVWGDAGGGLSAGPCFGCSKLHALRLRHDTSIPDEGAREQPCPRPRAFTAAARPPGARSAHTGRGRLGQCLRHARRRVGLCSALPALARGKRPLCGPASEASRQAMQPSPGPLRLRSSGR